MMMFNSRASGGADFHFLQMVVAALLFPDQLAEEGREDAAHLSTCRHGGSPRAWREAASWQLSDFSVAAT